MSQNIYFNNLTTYSIYLKDFSKLNIKNEEFNDTEEIVSGNKLIVTEAESNMINYSNLLKEGNKLLNESFDGVSYRLCNFWFELIHCNENIPKKYLEIGTFYGANAISVSNSYCKHVNSEIHCIDPWVDYSEYDEYKNKQSDIYIQFNKNIKNIENKDRFRIHRDFSYNILPKFENEYFDMIYIDGNHNPEYILEDAVLSFRKLKKGGYIIFDDYEWSNSNIGIHAFRDAYKTQIKILGHYHFQYFIQKLT